MEVPMKKHMKRIFALALAAALLTAQVAHASMALGSELMERDVALADGVTLSVNSLWSASKSDLRTEHYVTYTPGSGVTPMIYSGSYVASLNTVSAAAAAVEAQGYRVIAAINGGLFNTDGTIVGMLMTDGVLRSLDVANYTLVGVKSDGTFFLDESEITKAVSWHLPDGTEHTETLAGFNAYRNSNYLGGLYLYNNDFSSKVNASGDTVSVILRPISSGTLTMNSSLPLEVVSVTDTFAGDAFNGAIPEGCYMLYAQSQASESLLDSLRALVPGQQLTVSVDDVSSQWNDAVYGISAMYTLLQDGQIVSGLSTAANPYTALGFKADGTVVLYTIDGRRSGYSVGAAYSQVAQRLQELGCVTAVALDGGGSTTIGATLPGSDSFSVLNTPSGGSQRQVNNTILLVAPARSTGSLAGYYVDGGRLVLAGSSLAVTASPYDTAGAPLTGSTPSWIASGGSITGDGLTAIYTAGTSAGLYQITASGGGGQGTLPIRVVDKLSSLSVSQEGSSAAVTSLILSPGDVVELTASGRWYNLPVSFADEDVTWSIEGPIGAINGIGKFTAGNDNASGAILASAGGVTVRIPVTVSRGDPFTDMGGHWAADYVTQLYKLNITVGTQLPDGTYVFNPNAPMTRGELLIFLTRLLGVDPSLYSDVELPFADAASIPDWMLPYVKAMYALQVFQGSSDGVTLTANVSTYVDRQSTMTMIGRVLAGSDSCDLSIFMDADKVSSWASPYVQTLVARGVVGGNEGYLSPTANIDRASAAKILVMVYDMEKVTLTPISTEPAG